MWSKETQEVLLKYLAIRLELKNLNNADALFVGFHKGRGWSMRITKRSVERITKKYITKAGIKEHISPHGFRHGWAHKRRDMNAPLAFIQKGLGHSSPVSTFIYEQYNDKEFETNANSYLKPRRLTAKVRSL
jgi:integrase